MSFRSLYTALTPSSSIDVYVPSGVVNGDSLIGWAASGYLEPITGWPVGWNTVVSICNYSTFNTLSVMIREANNEPPYYTVTHIGQIVGGMLAYRKRRNAYEYNADMVGVERESPFSLVVGGIGTISDGCDLVSIAAYCITGYQAVTHQYPIEWVERANLNYGTFHVTIGDYMETLAGSITGTIGVTGTSPDNLLLNYTMALVAVPPKIVVGPLPSSAPKLLKI